MLKLLLIYFIINKITCANVSFKFNIGSYFELHCSYTLEQNEVIYKAMCKKDGQTFAEWVLPDKEKTNYTKIVGLNDPGNIQQGGGQMAINNYKTTRKDTFGVYECIVFYDIKGKVNPRNPGALIASKKFATTYVPKDECYAKWVSVTPGGNIPKGYVATDNKHGKNLVFCRGYTSSALVPGTLEGTTCVVPYGGGKAVTLTTFEVLTGVNFKFAQLPLNDSTNPPTDVYYGGKDGKDVMLARCRIDSTGYWFIGKWAPGGSLRYVDLDNNEKTNCEYGDVMICKQ